ncbi:FAD/NAD(P)-binding domain-containing protein [Zalerion maritima]|uniref:FAD/NAD(P)-binding domain-containing protein n=1 Tax=Zalerion maritima TaxID=339359 RepID=A0AAD5RRC9_9PEZI|nr:FAD/NAD(P)-binding domain-containing protein [Zalerion maritima]
MTMDPTATSSTPGPKSQLQAGSGSGSQSPRRREIPDTSPEGNIENKKNIINIIVLGASYAGISVSHYLLKHVLPSLQSTASSSSTSTSLKKRYKLLLISPSRKTICRPACPRAMLSEEMFDQEKLLVDVPGLFASYNNGGGGKENTESDAKAGGDGKVFEFIHGMAEGVDLEGRSVSVRLVGKGERAEGREWGAEGGGEGCVKTIPYCAIVIATGASTPSPLMGLNISAPSTSSEAQAEDPSQTLLASWTAFRSRLSSTKSIVIAGGGPTGVETAGELGAYLNGSPRSWLFRLSPSSTKKEKKPDVKITLITSAEGILPALRPSLARRAEELLLGLGVEVLKGVKVISVSTSPHSPSSSDNLGMEGKTTVRLSDGQELKEVDVYVPATGSTANTWFLPPDMLAGDGRVRTDSRTLRVTNEEAGEDTVKRVYALGDCSNYARPAIHNIFAAVPVVCQSIEEDLSSGGRKEGTDGVGNAKTFVEDTRETQLVPIGTRTGVGAAMGWKLPGWIVWLIKGRDYWLWTLGGLWSGKQWD